MNRGYIPTESSIENPVYHRTPKTIYVPVELHKRNMYSALVPGTTCRIWAKTQKAANELAESDAKASIKRHGRAAIRYGTQPTNPEKKTGTNPNGTNT